MFDGWIKTANIEACSINYYYQKNPKSKLLTIDYYILAYVSDASVIKKITNWFSKTTYIKITNKLTIPKNNIKQEINLTSK